MPNAVPVLMPEFNVTSRQRKADYPLLQLVPVAGSNGNGSFRVFTGKLPAAIHVDLFLPITVIDSTEICGC